MLVKGKKTSARNLFVYSTTGLTLSLEQCSNGGMSERIEIGYVCYKGHFIFTGDEEDSCRTKKVATLYAEPNEWADAEEMKEIIDFSLASVHQKIDAWRKG